MSSVNVLVEGTTDVSVSSRLLQHTGLEMGNVYGGKGKDYLLRRLHNYNQAACFGQWFTLVDLDNDAQCVSQALERWLPKVEHEAGMCFRVAVRAIEAWLLADREHLANFLDVSTAKFPPYPDREVNPKETLINIARSSTNKQIREDMLPRQGTSGREGPGYAARLIAFTDRHWEPAEATAHSESLQRCISALSLLKSREISE